MMITTIAITTSTNNNNKWLLRTHRDLGTVLSTLLVNSVNSHNNPHTESTISILTLQIRESK